MYSVHMLLLLCGWTELSPKQKVSPAGVLYHCAYNVQIFLFTDSHTGDAAADWASVVLPILPSPAKLPQAQEGWCWEA